MSDTPDIITRQAMPEDAPAIAALLDAARLPQTDDSVERVYSIVALYNDSVVGHAAVEVYDQCGLLRSVVTRSDVQRKGIASRLIDEAEVLAKDQGIAAIYLLTETAKTYFAKRSYQAIDRVEAPDSIRGSSEFSTVCPDSAVLMFKNLRTESYE